MKNIYNTNCALFGYKTRQKEIAKIGVSDELILKVKEKGNGYKDVFAYNEADEVGEFFRDESTDLLPFVSNPEKFKVKAIVKKLLSKEENMVSVIVDVSVFSEDNVDPDTYIEEFYNKKQENKINERNHIIVSNSPSEENKKIIGIVKLLYLIDYLTSEIKVSRNFLTLFLTSSNIFLFF
ncbi:hypothetical protein ACILE2_09245 [Capnocytophaga canimorsus]|uniref:hypothetical protein n=1 Tax=Capnocytophaga canimorsus TaxID=28188 RepID=UPI0037D19AFD